MSYSLTIAADASADLRRLDPSLQEAVLDELDVLAADVGLLPPAIRGSQLVYGFRCTSGNVLHHFTMVLARNDQQEKLIVLGVAHRQR